MALRPLLRAVLAMLLLGMAGLAHGQGAGPGPDCAADSELSYVCGANKPEDLLRLPGTPFLVSSGFAPGEGLKLVDTEARRAQPWFTGAAEQVSLDPAGWPQCPGPLDPALFNARGLSLSRLAGDRWRLLVVNHGGRESIEVFDVDLAPARPRLVWRGCLPTPAGQVANAVARFADGTVLATVLTTPGTTIGDFMNGHPTGAVWQWRPGEPGFREMPGTRLPGNNGLEVDPDQRHFYVVAFGWHAVMVFDRADGRGPLRRIVAPDFMPDNVHWSEGRLLAAGMRLDEPACGGLRRVSGRVADPMLCHRGWVVGAVDLAAGRIATVAYGHPQPGFSGLSSAVQVGQRLWLGSFQADRLAVIDLP